MNLGTRERTPLPRPSPLRKGRGRCVACARVAAGSAHARVVRVACRLEIGDWLVRSRSLGPSGLACAELRQSLSPLPKRLKSRRLKTCATGVGPRVRFMERPGSLLRMHWDHEPEKCKSLKATGYVYVHGELVSGGLLRVTVFADETRFQRWGVFLGSDPRAALTPPWAGMRRAVGPGLLPPEGGVPRSGGGVFIEH